MRGRVGNVWKIAVLALACVVLSPIASAQVAGGTTIGWYSIGPACDRDPFGVVANYQSDNAARPTAKADIDAMLQQMYDQGMRRLRIPIFFGHDINTGTVMSSTGGNLSAQHRRNLRDLLAAIKRVGFVEIVPAFMAVGPYNDPSNAKYIPTEESYLENWQLIRNLRPFFVESALIVRIDLGPEAIPAISQLPIQENHRNLLAYARRLWLDYTNAFGSADTVGFSIIGGETNEDRLATLPSIYGSNPPPVLAFDLYEDTYAYFVANRRKLQAMGAPWSKLPWIIEETFYNDFETAVALRKAITDTGQTVLYVMQWPLTKPVVPVSDPCHHVNIGNPASYWHYRGQGF